MNKEKKNTKRINLFFIVSIITSMLLTVSVIYNIKQNFYINKFNQDYKKIENDYNTLKDLYEEKEKINFELKDKVNFFNEHVFFVIEGFGNKYFSYNCMKNIMNGKEYEFSAYNKNQLISKGYEQHKCSIRVELGIE